VHTATTETPTTLAECWYRDAIRWWLPGFI
jgi:hypothetical protein